MSVKLTYRFLPKDRRTLPRSQLQLQDPLIAMLSAIHEHGSIGKAAKALGVSYRHLWGQIKQQQNMLGASLLRGGQGQAARLSEFGERLLWAEKRVLARLLPNAEELAAKIDHELLLAVEPALRPLPVAASHDMLFAALREQTRRQANVLLDIDYVGSALALARLNQGKCVLAGAHLPIFDEHLCQRGSAIHSEIGPHLRVGEHKLIRFASREQGLIVERGNPIGILGLADLARPEVSFINRQAGSGTRILLDELLRHAQIPVSAIIGYRSEERTHLSVAAHIAAGLANCGFGLRAAAVQFDLDFVPLVTEQYFIVCRKPALESEDVQAVVNILRLNSFRKLATSLPGYSAERAGEIISLRRTMPWYK